MSVYISTRGAAFNSFALLARPLVGKIATTCNPVHNSQLAVNCVECREVSLSGCQVFSGAWQWQSICDGNL